MINIGTVSFVISVTSLPPEEFEKYSTSLFDQWDRAINEKLALTDFSISLEIEEGSIKGTGKIAAGLTAIYFAIGNYGDFISGLNTLSEQVSYINAYLFENAKIPFGCNSVKATSRKNAGTLSKLQRLFYKVQHGQLNSDEAMLEAISLLGEEGKNNPDFLKELKSQLENTPRSPEQLQLGDEEWMGCIDEEVEDTRKTPPPAHPKSKPIPIPQRYRIEIWRESKKEKTRVKVTKI